MKSGATVIAKDETLTHHCNSNVGKVHGLLELVIIVLILNQQLVKVFM